MNEERLFQKMAAHTRDRCGTKKCFPWMRDDESRVGHCCNEMYCEISEKYAADRGIVLQRTDHKTLPFMGPKGCVVPPHLRPICTVHDCQIASFGLDKDNKKWTREYFELRDKISECMDLEATVKDI